MIVWVYILKCADGRYYVGTHRGEDPRLREAQHNAGFDPKAWTYPRRPVQLIWAIDYARADQAIAVERQLKGWSRAKKEAAMRGDWSLLPELARGKRYR